MGMDQLWIAGGGPNLNVFAKVLTRIYYMGRGTVKPKFTDLTGRRPSCRRLDIANTSAKHLVDSLINLDVIYRHPYACAVTSQN